MKNINNDQNTGAIERVDGHIQQDPTLRPIPIRECACGCGHEFYPRRKDHIYLNRQHANYGYNHNKRKLEAQNQVETERVLRKNDRILKKYFKAFRKGEYAFVYLDILKADGFKSGYIVGLEPRDKVTFYYSYNYYYERTFQSGKYILKIYKR
ncbi:hypothetical protein KO566_12735 [Flavobacteriaceae bacterium XHP0103]|uniref:hypothetical protein n=1 Tax=Marixanthotalea marina TaxID=2844359 RepID=UPI002989AD34|nr:hypothetical protein [Marixanthotalea marina]MBU3822930.1 hypothetical protein [Marixanthotalea marina]